MGNIVWHEKESDLAEDGVPPAPNMPENSILSAEQISIPILSYPNIYENGGPCPDSTN